MNKFFYAALFTAVAIMVLVGVLLIALVSWFLTFIGLGAVVPFVSLAFGVTLILGMWDKIVHNALGVVFNAIYSLFNKGEPPVAFA